MKRITFFAPVAGMLMLLALSCNKETVMPDGQTPEGGEKATVCLSVNSAPGTKASATENKMGSIEVFVFDVDPASGTNGTLEFYHNATSAELSTAKINLTTSVGKKNIYVLINNDGLVAPYITKESDLKIRISEYPDNYPDHFLMVGGIQETLSNASVNNLTISCKRLVAKISFGTIIGGLENPALMKSFKLEKVYVANVPKRASLLNGDANDVFGIIGTSAFAKGTEGCPDIFIPAIKSGTEYLPYYKYEMPSMGPSTPNGYFNFHSAADFNSSHTVNISSETTATTVKDLSSAVLYPATGTQAPSVSVSSDFYTFPNPAPHSTTEGDRDWTTKVVVIATVKVGDEYKTCYYPISIPYTQPNYYYRIESLTIKNFGTTDPSLPVKKADCAFTVSVRDWDTGKITGVFNNETSEGNFTF